MCGLFWSLQVSQWKQDCGGGGLRAADWAQGASSGEPEAGTRGEVALWPQDSPLTCCMTYFYPVQHKCSMRRGWEKKGPYTLKIDIFFEVIKSSEKSPIGTLYTKGCVWCINPVGYHTECKRAQISQRRVIRVKAILRWVWWCQRDPLLLPLVWQISWLCLLRFLARAMDKHTKKSQLLVCFDN